MCEAAEGVSRRETWIGTANSVAEVTGFCMTAIRPRSVVSSQRLKTQVPAELAPTTGITFEAEQKVSSIRVRPSYVRAGRETISSGAVSSSELIVTLAVISA